MSRFPEVTIARELAARFGLHRAGREWRGACPCCSYPDAFVLSERQGHALAWCASCQDKRAIAGILRGAGALPERARADAPARPDPAATAERRARALALWHGAEPAPGTAAETYLITRGLPGLAASPALRFRTDCPHPNGGRLPALIALVQAPDGMNTGIHRTFLRRDGSGKAAVEPAKATLGPIGGGAIRLDPAAAELVVGEGIESSASAGRMLVLPAWAAVSAGNLARALVLPPEVCRVVIAADNDPRGQGQDAARSAWHRWTAESRRVRIATPNAEGCDFNDLIRESADG